MRYFRDRLRLAFEAYDRIATPAGTCPVIGDSDPSPVAPFLTLGRALFPDLALTRRLTPGAAHVWYGVREDDAAPTAPAPHLQLFPHAGFAVVRDAGAYLTFDCGTKGEWHGHADLLHVHYWLGEEMILGDGGRWLYNGDAFRHWALSPRAHNTVAVDGRAMAALEDPAHPALGPIHAHEADGIMRLHAWHDAFSLPDEPVRCRRFLAVDPLVGWLLVVDELTAAAPQSWQQYWLFPREDVTLNDTGVAIGTTARMLLHGGRRTLRSQDWSPSYSVRAPGRQLTVSLRQSSAVLAMLLLPWKIDGALTVDDSPSQWTVDVTAGAFHARLSATDWNETTGSSRKRNA